MLHSSARRNRHLNPCFPTFCRSLEASLVPPEVITVSDFKGDLMISGQKAAPSPSDPDLTNSVHIYRPEACLCGLTAVIIRRQRTAVLRLARWVREQTPHMVHGNSDSDGVAVSGTRTSAGVVPPHINSLF